MGLATILGSKGTDGIETSVAGTDLIEQMLTRLGWDTSTGYATKEFEFFVTEGNIEVSVNGNDSFILRADDSIVENKDSIASFKIMTNGCKYRYSAKF